MEPRIHAGHQEARAHAEEGRDGAHEHGDGRMAMWTISRDATIRAGTRWGLPRHAGDILEGVEVDVEQLIERDGPECVWCGRELWRRDLTLDHVVPRSRGGHMTQENALLACRSCNRRRGARPVDAYVRDRLREGAEVDVDAVRRSLTRLAGSPRRAHREAAARQLQRLATV
jgi:hypothetical protein